MVVVELTDYHKDRCTGEYGQSATMLRRDRWFLMTGRTDMGMGMIQGSGCNFEGHNLIS
jgi:hypothetical protein